MSKPSDTTPPSRDEVIDRIYDVALDPTRLEALLDGWEELVAPLRQAKGADTQVWTGIEAHFNRAAQVMERVGPSPEPDDGAAILAPFDKVAAVLLDETGTITHLNPAAEQVLGATPGNRLTTLDIEADDIEVLIRTARNICAGRSKREQLIRVRSAEDGRFILFHMRRCFLPSAGARVLAATTETAWPDGFADLLRQAFGLTSAEVDVVRQIVECQSIKDIAEVRGRSVDTVRVQVKSILSKTEARSQAELVRLALSMMDLANVSPIEGYSHIKRAPAVLLPRPTQTLWTAEGRRLDYLTYGAETGRPLLYLHGAYGLTRWPPAAEALAQTLGLRVIVPIRAGYGASDLHPSDADYPVAQAADLIAVLDAEGVEQTAVLTMGSDFYFGTWLAHLHGSRVTRLFGAAPPLPLTRAEQYERMEKWHRFINAGARYTPRVLPFMVKAGFLLARRVGKRGFIHAAHGACQADVDTFETPEVFTAFEVGTDVAMSATHSAHEAFARQVIAQEGTDWRPALMALEGKVPITCFFGTEDPQMPRATQEEWQADAPWIDWQIRRDAGQLVLFRHLDDILTALARP
ncbi:helix-turn-helix transcriptional regulator [Jannaschia pagri]|uniref:Helix-turn-helix transcriptional regulator n=1 Tax=Jannaschia pagri TaxID=2829797 RepID=A0ABQ4NJ20_9RHOB|nr:MULTISPECIES: alpha/beta fold hydrolase [unclassified Jannaschia]GIT90565.1 helix-turn-helix transcriptional regulator [Jannaschia sp. AI_61]GIT94397.1 helix-turn-helix transcriptional regulator [Jannaschia sp. AI_62]